MNASPSMNAPLPGATAARATRIDRIEISPRWRAGQVVATVLVALMALYFNTIGWQTPGGAQGDSHNLVDQAGFLVLLALVWMSTPNAGVIALTTVQEALRRRWMLVLLGFSVLLLGASSAFVGLQPGEEERFLQDFGTGFIITMTLLMAIFLGVSLIPPDIERRTIFTILSKPVNRNEFILGKFLGLCATLLVNLVVLSATFLTAYTIFVVGREGLGPALLIDPDNQHFGLAFTLGNLSNALILHAGQLVVMSALALTLSIIVSNITAIVFCFLAYFGGQMSSYWQNLGSDRSTESSAPGLSRGMQGVVNVVYYLLPRLDRFEVREKLVNDSPVAFGYVWKAWSSGLIYAAILLIIAGMVFSDREF